jgi:hypothetical protein
LLLPLQVGQPFDTIKTRLQVLGKGTIGAAGMPPEMVYNNGMDCVRKMVGSARVCWYPRHAAYISHATNMLWVIPPVLVSVLLW